MMRPAASTSRRAVTQPSHSHVTPTAASPRHLQRRHCRRRLAILLPHAAGSPFASLSSTSFLGPAAAQEVPLSSIADMRRQVGSDLDDFFAASPFSTMRRLDDMMEQQMQAMDPFGGSSGFGGSGGLSGMRERMLDMDRQMDRAFADMDRVQRELDTELQRSLRQLEQQQPGVRIERREEKAPGSYRYYESIQISGGSSWTTLTPAHSHAAFFNPLLFAAVVLAGAYAAVTAAFARNYDLTTYGERSRWRLLLLWPVLAVFSRRFWRQFSSALRGEKVRLQEQEGGVDVGVADGGVLTGPTTGSSSGNSGSGSRS